MNLRDDRSSLHGIGGAFLHPGRVMSEASVIFRTAEPPRPTSESVPGQEAIWREEEFREWPPLDWPEEPIRPPAPSKALVWQVRGLAVLGAIGVVLLFQWLLTPDLRGDSWFF